MSQENKNGGLTIWAISLGGEMDTNKGANNATRRQAMALADTLKILMPGEHTVRFIQPFIPKDAVELPSKTIVTWTKPPTLDELRELPCAAGDFKGELPDIAIGCRPEVAALLETLKLQGKTKIVAIQDPQDNPKTGEPAFHVDRSRYDLIVAQSQEPIAGQANQPGSNVISSTLPLHDLTPEQLAGWRKDALETFPQYEQRPITAVLIGGSDEHVGLTAQDFVNFGEDIGTYAKGKPGGRREDVYVLSSRRTTPEQIASFKKGVETAFGAPMKDVPNVFFDHPDMSYNRVLGLAAVFDPKEKRGGASIVSDAGSGSMGVETEYTGTPWVTYTYRDKMDAHPQAKVWPNVPVDQLPLFTPPSLVGERDERIPVGLATLRALNLPIKAQYWSSVVS